MAFDKYKNGAWMEPESSVKKYKDGAWTDCDSAKRYVNGAWTEVWTNMDIMGEEINTLTTGFLVVNDHGKELTYMKIMDTDPEYGSISGEGRICFLLKGPFVDPELKADWSGGFIYRASDGTFNRVSAGTLYTVYQEIGDPTVWFTPTEIEVGSTRSNCSEHASGSINLYKTGEYAAVGFVIIPHSFQGKFTNASLTITLNNVRFRKKYKVGFPESSEFDRQEWPS